MQCAGHLAFVGSQVLLNTHETEVAGFIQGAFITAFLIHDQLTNTEEQRHAKNVH